ncbi:MAG: nuclear transport factor 2 family protein [Verrucomicrobia bacterium]|nr:MAG: nuclear transport factor 2 family protein [Verrucomicrobiota bacterium]PYL05397.1 MAG: nuclear transport factor 2 family protein [Verrucomicrobiota bacterium]PYL31464.1 MAG: nuclear transport factor 2 family protein [Verrucomicrobiota bacterium]
MNQTTNDGEKMERKMWEDIKAKNWEAVEGKIAEGFQSVHVDGARDRAGEITLIKKLGVGQVALSDFKSTMNDDNIVVTYMISAQESIDLERLPTKPAPRLSVWKKGASGWQWICHANLTPIP